jgi:hypothetical protein
VYQSFHKRVNDLALLAAVCFSVVNAHSQEAVEPQPASTDSPTFAAVAGEHQPVTAERFAPYRDELIASARALEQALGIDSQLARDWKRYLKWDLLEPQLVEDSPVSRASLENMATVLRRFRSNHPGLELPVFTRTADAIDRYRDLAFWYALAERRDTVPLYESFAKDFDEQLRRHMEAPTSETTLQIGRALGTIDYLGEAPELVEVVRASYSQPNVLADVSTEALNELAGPVCQIRGVRDCILGTSIRGTAITNGLVTFQPLEASARIEIDMFLAGIIRSRTVGYNKPVNIHASGTTNYSAGKRLLISDDEFTTAGLWVDADTRTRIHSVQKTGGKLGKKLIEKIAWKKVYEKKRQSERIASRHAEQKIASNFDSQVLTALTNGRVSYEGRLRAPLKRVALLTETIRLASSHESIHSQLTVASHRQIATNSTPPEKLAGNDVTVQVHETAINNFLPTLLAGASLRQESADQPPRLEGDVPKWLRELAKKTPKEAVADKKSPREEPIANETAPAEPKAEFRPWHFTLNIEAPASVSFTDQKLVLRMRLAELKASADEEEEPRKNWDFIVTYRLIQEGNEVLLKREGDIEAFPTGFDPRWDERLTGEQVGVRNNMAKNLNKRAAAGEGFPAEIPLPAVKLPKGDEEITLELTQLECDNGWLTIGYRVP